VFAICATFLCIADGWFVLWIVCGIGAGLGVVFGVAEVDYRRAQKRRDAALVAAAKETLRQKERDMTIATKTNAPNWSSHAFDYHRGRKAGADE
jgi:hypothetical protein